MYNVYGFMLVMVPTSDGDIDLKIRYMENDCLEESHVECLLRWIQHVKRGLANGKKVEHLIVEFKDAWYDFMLNDLGWASLGYSVDYESFHQAARELFAVLEAAAEGARPYNLEGRERKSRDYITNH